MTNTRVTWSASGPVCAVGAPSMHRAFPVALMAIWPPSNIGIDHTWVFLKFDRRYNLYGSSAT